jgi:hypothetical protein
MNCKYHLENPNIFCCRDRNASPFLKGFLWAAQAAKIGYIWKFGNGGGLDFGKISGWRLVILLYNFGRFI